MRLLPLIAILAFVVAVSTQAGQEAQHLAAPTPGAPDGSLNVGQGVICDTLEQARRLVSLQNDGRAINEALGTVNQEAHNPTACGPAKVLFRVAAQIDGDRLAGQPVNLVKIVISAINTGDRWSDVPDVEQYAILPPAGIEI